MSINIQAKTNYSSLFSSLGSSKGGGMSNLNFLSDYASIKNGSYGKLMKAYYAKDNSDNSAVKSITKTASKENAKTLAKVQTTTDALKESADALLETGKDSVFTQKDITTTDANGQQTTAKGYDKDAIYNAVSDFVEDYNSVLNAAGGADSTSITKRASYMAANTASYSKMLNSIGITIGKDNSLSIDKETFKNADMSKVKSLFQGNGSFGYQTSAQASMMNFAADNEANKTSLYGGNGLNINTNKTGNLFNSFF